MYVCVCVWCTGTIVHVHTHARRPERRATDELESGGGEREVCKHMARCERRTRTSTRKRVTAAGGKLGGAGAGGAADEERLRRQIDDYERKVDSLLEEVGAVKADAELKTALQVSYNMYHPPLRLHTPVQ